jgi:hypothetical protein
LEPSLRTEKWKRDKHLHSGRQGPLGRLYLGFRRGAWDCPDDPDCHWRYPHCSAVTFDWPLGNLDRRKCYHHVLSRKVRLILILNYFFHFLKEPEARELSEKPEVFLCPNVLGDSSRAPSFLMNF